MNTNAHSNASNNVSSNASDGSTTSPSPSVSVSVGSASSGVRKVFNPYAKKTNSGGNSNINGTNATVSRGTSSVRPNTNVNVNTNINGGGGGNNDKVRSNLPMNMRG